MPEKPRTAGSVHRESGLLAKMKASSTPFVGLTAIVWVKPSGMQGTQIKDGPVGFQTYRALSRGRSIPAKFNQQPLEPEDLPPAYP